MLSSSKELLSRIHRKIHEKHEKGYTPASNLGYLAPPPGQFFMGAKLFTGTSWMGNEGVLKQILVWAM